MIFPQQCSPNQESPGRGETPSSTPVMSGKSILVVADEARAAEKLAILLEQLGYSVSGVVNTPLDAFAHADAVKLDMALVDIQIKGDFTGMDIARRFHAEYDIPVILLIPHLDPQIIAKAAAADPFGYIVRPFRRSTLAATMTTALKRRSTEQRLATTTRRLHAPMQSIGDAVIALDSELRVSFVNAVAERLIGWTNAQAVGEPASEVLQIRTRSGEDITDLVDEAAKGSVMQHVDATLLTRNGAQLSIDHSIAPIRDGSGRLSDWLIVLRDRSSRWYEARVRKLEMEFEDKIRERTGSLEASNQALSAFVMSVAHDLRTPLRAINGYASRLMEEHEEILPDEGRRLLTNVLTSASRLGDLVEGYLRLSRLSAAGLRKQDVDMNRVAHEAWADVMAAELQAPRLSITGMPSVRGDESLLRQVWVNLFSNAVKFSRLSPAPQVEVTARDAGDVVCFRVQDNGVGFDPLYRDRLFRPFERLHAQSEFEGNGMGLSIVQQILQRHGGDVSIEASIGKGAAVEFWLPKK
jgi:PAS domain S-box-containing protein